MGGKTYNSVMYDLLVTGYDNRTNRLHLFDLDSIDDGIIGDGISFDKTDINKNYMLLADCYNMLGSTRQLTELREQVPTMGLTLERNILSHIDDLIKSSSSTPSENFPTEN